MRTVTMSLARLRPWQLVLAVRIWATFLGLLLSLRRRPLPEVVTRLGSRPRRPPRELPPHRLSRISYRVLRIGPYRPRCLYRALVLYRLLRMQGEDAMLVIGLPEAATSKDAHAWVEIGDRDVGPPPGRVGHTALVRYPEQSWRHAT